MFFKFNVVCLLVVFIVSVSCQTSTPEVEDMLSTVEDEIEKSLSPTNSPGLMDQVNEITAVKSPQSVVGAIREGYGHALNALTGGPTEMGQSLFQTIMNAVSIIRRFINENDIQTPVAVVTSLLNRKSRQINTAVQSGGLFDIIKRTLMSLASIISADFKHIGFLMKHFGLALIELSKSLTAISDDLAGYSNGSRPLPDMVDLNSIGLDSFSTAAPMRKLSDQVVKMLMPGASQSTPSSR